MLRLFTGFSLPASLRARLALLQGGIPGARWIPPENFHVTLAFIGDADEAMAEDIDSALRDLRLPDLPLQLKGLGSFAQGDDPKILWAGVGLTPALAGIKEKTDRALEMARIDFERRKYVPHVTLARFRNPDEGMLVEFMNAKADFESAPFDATSFHLYQSHQTKNGSVYEILASYPLLQL